MVLLRKIAKRALTRMGYEISKPQEDYSIPVSLKMLLGALLLDQTEVWFVQVGAFDGLSGDPIYEYIKRYPLKGVLVEPQQSAYQKLQQTYANNRGLRFANVAVAEQDGTANLYCIRDDAIGPDWLHQLASFDKAALMHNLNRIPDLESMIETKTVPTLTPATLVANYQIDRLDLLIIDTEGYDFEVIKLFDRDGLLPRVILYEHKHLGDSLETCRQFLLHKKYRLTQLQVDTLAFRSIEDDDQEY